MWLVNHIVNCNFLKESWRATINMQARSVRDVRQLREATFSLLGTLVCLYCFIIVCCFSLCNYFSLRCEMCGFIVFCTFDTRIVVDELTYSLVSLCKIYSRLIWYHGLYFSSYIVINACVKQGQRSRVRTVFNYEYSLHFSLFIHCYIRWRCLAPFPVFLILSFSLCRPVFWLGF